jgi:hypothetical protein
VRHWNGKNGAEQAVQCTDRGLKDRVRLLGEQYRGFSGSLDLPVERPGAEENFRRRSADQQQNARPALDEERGQPRQTIGDLLLVRPLIPGRATPDDVGHAVIAVPLQSVPDEQGIERAPGLADEALANLILIRARRLTDRQ